MKNQNSKQKSLDRARFVFVFSIVLGGFLFFCGAGKASADNHYVYSGATGLATGNDWTNAYTALPAALVRGDTYYIADGNYPAYTVDDAISGTLVITIKKVTTSDHGTNVGWDSSYGDGRAIFAYGTQGSAITISTSYVIWDGVTGNGSDHCCPVNS